MIRQFSCLSAAALIGSAGAASASTITGSILETFDSAATTATTFTYLDFGAPRSNTDPAWTVAGGQATYTTPNDFGDVGSALVQFTAPATPPDFSVSGDFQVNTLDFNGDTRIGLVAYSNNPNLFSQVATGLQGFVEAVGNTDNQYRVGLANSDTVLSTSAFFDLTDGSPDFSLSLSGTFLPNGDLTTTVSFVDSGGQNVVTPIIETIAAGDLDIGPNFGVRIQSGFNPISIGVDNLAVVVPEPGSLALAAAGLALIGVRRRR